MTAPTTDRRAARHEATKARILDAAWALAREHGLAGISLRDLAAAVDLRQPSLYSYFESKNALYDAMFAQGYQQLLDVIDGDRAGRGPEEQLRGMARTGSSGSRPRTSAARSCCSCGRCRTSSRRRRRTSSRCGSSTRPEPRLTAAGLDRRQDSALYTVIDRRDREPAARERPRGDASGSGSSTRRWTCISSTRSEAGGSTDGPRRPRWMRRAIPAIGHDEAMRIAQVEYDRMLEAMRELDDEDWKAPTANTEWDVRSMLLHMLGSADASASTREMARQLYRGKRLFNEIGGEHWVDGMNEIQIRDRATLSNAEVVDRYASVVPKAVRARTRLPRPVAALRIIPIGPPFGRMPLGWLMDGCLTRDVWMHRADLAVRHRSADDADGRARRPHRRRHRPRMGRPLRSLVRARAGGPAGGTYATGSGGETTCASTRSTSSVSSLGAARHPDCSSPTRSRCRPLEVRPERSPPSHRPRNGVTMETTTTEIADGIHRISTFLDPGMHVQPVPRRRRRAAAVPHRPPPAVPAGVGGRREGSSRPSHCAGSRSATSRRTSAGR